MRSLAYHQDVHPMGDPTCSAGLDCMKELRTEDNAEPSEYDVQSVVLSFSNTPTTLRSTQGVSARAEVMTGIL